jgi:Protein of unknown function (DUF3828)
MYYSKKTTMKQIIILLTIILLVSCGQNSDNKASEEVSSTESYKQKDNLPVNTALKFINLYVDNCNKTKESVGIVEWVNSNNLTTNRFKTELKSIIEEAYKIDPEMGLDADPIFDAQDYPDKGFEVESFDNETNYIVVKGKDRTDFKLTMKLVLENDNWMVDGCGIINIPNDKRIAR